MIKLGGAGAVLRGFPSYENNKLFLLSENPLLPMPLRHNRALIVRDRRPPQTIPEGYEAYFAFADGSESTDQASHPCVILPTEYEYLGDGDVVRVSPQGAIRVLYRKSSKQNFILVTEQCNNYCLMCSQPPKKIDDAWIIDEIAELIPLIDRGTREITFTGGEPTLFGSKFLELISLCKSWLPKTAIHILSNGRSFADLNFAQRYAAIDHPDIMVGIPVYSDLSTHHDYVVQADGAFDETIRGILNLKRMLQRVEIRVVLHKQTYERLPQLAEFLARNLLFVDQVVFMGLEITGFTRANLADLWIDPVEYQAQLRIAVEHLNGRQVRVAIYNHQLCVLDPALWPYARRSISDWKNEYMPECSGCEQMGACGGFFSSAKLRYSAHIRPLSAAPA